ncbi:MAG: DUF1015 domain-containing protein [Thermodesulfobacteria bacterium]|nr:DUF1015 domain-containing protein [Thermodesulfobacteriota bacterium]
MVEIKPFHGWRYNPKRVRLEDVLAPPYDVVTPEEQKFYLEKSPYNVFHLELGATRETDTSSENRYTRAKKYWDTWRREGILLREEKPAIYLYRLSFSWQGKELTRRGFISLVRLAPWKSRKILPHEKTFDRVTEDRLNLLRATRAQFSQIFCLYHDKTLESLQTLESHAEPLFTVKNKDETHELLRVTDPDAQERVQNLLAKGPLYIADGHHRYTTALRFMKEMEEKYGAEPPRCFHYMMMYLCPFEDPGLLVLPTHRLVSLPLKREDLFGKLQKFGTVERLPELPPREELKRLPPSEFLILHEGEVFRFSVSPEVLKKWEEENHPKIAHLPVAIFTKLLREALSLSETELKERGELLYTPWIDLIQEKARGNWWGFLLPPTPVLALEEVAQASLVMPHKSTYFHPKILTGTVFFEILPDAGPPC